MTTTPLKNILEAAILASSIPLSLADLAGLFEEEERPTNETLREALSELAQDYETRGIELKQTASGYRFQARQETSPWLSKLFSERPARYTRAFLETLALIAYRQPITRGEIEEIRGVAVNPNIIRTLSERAWVKVVGHRDVPGKPELLGTTKEFLDYFNLTNLSELPSLQRLESLESLEQIGQSVEKELGAVVETESAPPVEGELEGA